MKDAGTSKEIKGLTDLKSLAENATAWLVVTIILGVLFLILLLICAFMVTHIRLACGLIAEASRAIGEMLSALFFPLLPWFLQLVWFTWFAVILIYLMSNGTKQYRVSQNDTNFNLTVEQVSYLLLGILAKQWRQKMSSEYQLLRTKTLRDIPQSRFLCP